MILYIAIDDTDNLETRGTGYRARCLAELLHKEGFGEITGISRHQLYVNSEIPYTSHNSSLCIGLEAKCFDKEALIKICSEYIEAESAEGSDPGLCIASSDMINKEIIKFGKSAKKVVLTKAAAKLLTQQYDIHLSEHGGTGGGIIGSLAAVGLREGGNDGRYVWLKGIREMQGKYSANEILVNSGVKQIRTEEGEQPEKNDIVDVGDWFRPVLLDGMPTLLVEKNMTEGCWKILGRESIKAKY